MSQEFKIGDLEGSRPVEMVPPRKPALRLLTCGSVDDGKSTLIGRLLYDSRLIRADQFAALARDSRKYGSAGDNVDYALLLDGLEAEREQGVTIDVAYRYFSTAARSFIVADAPGHEQYTRNMVTAASNADLAIILVDARKGLLPQTFRHAFVVALLGIRHVVLAVNKIDLVDFEQTVFDDIVAAFGDFAAKLDFRSATAIPISARYGDNVSSKSSRTGWYRGFPLLAHLEQVDVEEEVRQRPFRMAVQWVNRAHLDFRGFSGTIASGELRAGDEIVVAGSGRLTRVVNIVTADGNLDVAQAGDAVTLTLADEGDISRGDVLAAPKDRPQVADQFAAKIIWMAGEPLLPGRSYLMKIGTRTVPATITELKHRIDVGTLASHAAKTLGTNEIGVCNVATAAPVAFDPYAENRATGAFILIDRSSNSTSAAGMISFGLRRAGNIHHQELIVTKAARAQLKQQRPAILWFTGLSGAGKSTIANLVEVRLSRRGAHTALLDGDNVRHGLSRDLGFTEVDRVENIRRVGAVAKLMTDAGLIVLCSFISPFCAERRMIRESVDDGEFIEIFVDAPIEQCMARDPKGLYRRALAGSIKNFTGIGQAYEPPERPEIHLNSGTDSAEACAERVISALLRREII